MMKFKHWIFKNVVQRITGWIIQKTEVSRNNDVVPPDICNGMRLRVAEGSVHSSGDPSAYIGMEGKVEGMKEDGSFILNLDGCGWIVSSGGKDRNGLRFYGRQTKIIYEKV